MKISFEMVIHGDFGGFSFTREIVERLRARGCTWAADVSKASSTGPWYPPADMEDENEIRRDPDLVAVVKELRAELESRLEDLPSWKDRAALERELLNGLKVVEVNVDIDIEDDDGKERVRVYGGAY